MLKRTGFVLVLTAVLAAPLFAAPRAAPNARRDDDPSPIERIVRLIQKLVVHALDDGALPTVPKP